MNKGNNTKNQCQLHKANTDYDDSPASNSIYTYDIYRKRGDCNLKAAKTDPKDFILKINPNRFTWPLEQGIKIYPFGGDYGNLNTLKECSDACRADSGC